MEGTLQEIFVDTGDVRTCKGLGILHAGAIGSCVVITAYDPDSAVGGMAHVMLPGQCSSPASAVRTKYSMDALEELMLGMLDLGAVEARVLVCLIGGADVIGDGFDGPGPDIIRSLTDFLATRGITPVAREVGGSHRRSCSLHLACGRVSYTVGDSESRTLWEARIGSS